MPRTIKIILNTIPIKNPMRFLTEIAFTEDTKIKMAHQDISGAF